MLRHLSSARLTPSPPTLHTGTDKVRWARGKPAVHAVSVDWLASCGYLWRQADERATPVEAAPPPGAARIGPDFKGTLAPPQMR